MPAWNDYKSAAKARGSLAFELYVIESTPAKGPEDLKATLPDHLAYQSKMESEGHLFLAGPTSDPTGEQMLGNGLIVYRASSMEEARKLAEATPCTKQVQDLHFTQMDGQRRVFVIFLVPVTSTY